MTIKILSGTARGTNLAVPISDKTRPTSVMLKRKIFDANQNIEELIFIDLCAGVGTVGLEALSRGVEKLFLVEKNFQCLKILNGNVRLVREKSKETEVVVDKKDAVSWIEYRAAWLSRLDRGIIFFDPPYENLELYRDVINLLKKIKFPGQIWTEACRQKTMHEDKFMEEFYKGKVYRQGTSYVVVGTLDKM